MVLSKIDQRAHGKNNSNPKQSVHRNLHALEEQKNQNKETQGITAALARVHGRDVCSYKRKAPEKNALELKGSEA